MASNLLERLSGQVPVRIVNGDTLFFTGEYYRRLVAVHGNFQIAFDLETNPERGGVARIVPENEIENLSTYPALEGRAIRGLNGNIRIGLPEVHEPKGPGFGQKALTYALAFAAKATQSF